MRVTLVVILTFLVASEAAKLVVEEIVLREGTQKNRQERRFDNKKIHVIQHQEVEIVYEEPGNRNSDRNSDGGGSFEEKGDIIEEEIVIVQETDLGPVTPNSLHKGGSSEKMSCKESAIFFGNLGYVSNIRQNHLIFSTKIYLQKVISTEMLMFLLRAKISTFLPLFIAAFMSQVKIFKCLI